MLPGSWMSVNSNAMSDLQYGKSLVGMHCLDRSVASVFHH